MFRKKVRKKEVRKKKFSTKFTSSVQGKKKYWNIYPKGWGLRIPSIPPTQHNIHNSPSTLTHPTKTLTQPTLDCMPLGLTADGRKHQQVGRCSCAPVTRSDNGQDGVAL